MAQAPENSSVTSQYQHYYHDDLVIYNVALQEEVLSLDETPVNHILGVQDMYRDTDKPTKDHAHGEDYCLDDKKLILEYMEKKSHKRPLDVWFDWLEAIMEIDLDSKGNYMDIITAKAFYHDAFWFCQHNQFSMAICTTETVKDEYILPENSYGVFEGSSCFITDRKTGRVEPGPWFQFHEFSPVSPKIMIVLRNHMLPPDPQSGGFQ
ncbi:uncharacterized protein DNG_02984 [Cephalotrichum gorgonifer]|uniref:Uncharacterized protein n=1 Tax=Cephalotrichum gorgonifer TaxID=2041049 RepID=A0AAE8STJ3_9PEZI|nr:uncharacterized protein DNG_02984 [Cephalotrichum gorgonifer]